MKYLKLFENFVLLNEAIKFKLNTELDDKINSIQNKNKAKTIESFLVKSILTNFYNFIKNETDREIDKNYPSWNTQQKLDYFLNNSDEFLKNSFNGHINRRYNSKLHSIIDYIHANNINSNNFEDLYQKSVQWHNDIANKTPVENNNKLIRKDETEDTDRFIEYPNGWYWINLNVSYSQDESDNMGHCGRDAGKILFSLRDDNNKSHVTVSYDVDEKAMYQCKGRGNTKPKDIYHKYIIDLLLNDKYPINMIMTGSYRPDLDFNLMDLTEEERDDILSEKPSFEYTDNMFESYFKNEEWQKVASMIVNGFVYGGDYICSDISLLKYLVEQKLDLSLFIHDNWFKPLLNKKSSKEDIEFYKEYYDKEMLNNNCADIVYILWKNGYISSSDAENRISDLVIKDGEWYVKYQANSLSDLYFMFSEDGVDRNSISYRDYVKNLDDVDYYDLDYELSDCDLSDLDNESKKEILLKIKNELGDLDESQIEELIDNDLELSFESIEDYSFDKLMNDVLNPKYGYDIIEKLLEMDGIEDIKYEVINGYEDAQRSANESDEYNTILSSLSEYLGDKIEWSSKKGKGKLEGKDISCILLKFNPDYAFLLHRIYEDLYYMSSLEKIFDKIFDSGTREDAYNENIDEEEFPEYLTFKYPYYGFHGIIDIKDLNEIVRDRL